MKRAGLLQLLRQSSLTLALFATAMSPGAAQAPAAPVVAQAAADPAAPVVAQAAADSAASGGTPTEDGQALAKTERFRRLAGELRCLVCQNQSLVDSNAPLAQDLREEVVKLMASGRDDDQIKSFLVERYGEFVLYRPAVSMRNALLWFGPLLLLVIAAVAWMRLGRRQVAPAPSAHEALKHVDELLGR